MKFLGKGVSASRDVFRKVKRLIAVNFLRKKLHLRHSAGPENASGFTVVNYFHQKLHLKSLRGIIRLCMKKLKIVALNMLFLRIAVRKISYIFKKNIPVKLLFHKKFQVTWHLLLMFFWEIYEIFRSFHKNTREWRLLQLVITGKCFDQSIFFKNISFNFFNLCFDMCSQGLSV